MNPLEKLIELAQSNSDNTYSDREFSLLVCKENNRFVFWVLSQDLVAAPIIGNSVWWNGVDLFQIVCDWAEKKFPGEKSIGYLDIDWSDPRWKV
jgi:hypothetical protein